METENKTDSTVNETTETTEQTTEETIDSTQDPLDLITDPEELRKAAKAQRAIANRRKERPQPKINNQDTKSVETVRPSDILRSQEFSLHRDGYNEDEIDLIMKNGGREILKDEKNPLVLGLKIAREQRKAELAATQAGDTTGTSALERKYTKTDLEKMKPDELEKVIGFAN